MQPQQDPNAIGQGLSKETDGLQQRNLMPETMPHEGPDIQNIVPKEATTITHQAKPGFIDPTPDQVKGPLEFKASPGLDASIPTEKYSKSIAPKVNEFPKADQALQKNIAEKEAKEGYGVGINNPDSDVVKVPLQPTMIPKLDEVAYGHTEPLRSEDGLEYGTQAMRMTASAGGFGGDGPKYSTDSKLFDTSTTIPDRYTDNVKTKSEMPEFSSNDDVLSAIENVEKQLTSMDSYVEKVLRLTNIIKEGGNEAMRSFLDVISNDTALTLLKDALKKQGNK